MKNTDPLLVKDLYKKYAPSVTVDEERLKKIDEIYGDDNKLFVQDFYKKYAPDKEVTDEQFNTISEIYNLKKNNTPSGTDAGNTSQEEPSYSYEDFAKNRNEYYSNKISETTTSDELIKEKVNLIQNVFQKKVDDGELDIEEANKQLNLAILNNKDIADRELEIATKYNSEFEKDLKSFQKIEDAKKQLKPFSFTEEVSNTWDNIVENTKTLDDRAQLLLNRMAEPIENAVFGDKANALRLASNMTALEELDKSSQKLKPTQSISDAIASGDPEKIAAGVVTSVMQLGESVAKTAVSGGLYPFVEGPTSLYYQTLQETAADGNEKPLSVILDNEDKVAIPAIGGVISGAIEKIGLDKVTKGILGKAPMGFWKKMTDVAVTSGVEGATESMQSIIEQVSVQVANGKEIDIAWKEVLDSGLVGAIGGGAISGASNTVKSIRQKPNEQAAAGPDNTQDGTEAATPQEAQPENGVVAPTGDLGTTAQPTADQEVASKIEEERKERLSEQKYNGRTIQEDLTNYNNGETSIIGQGFKEIRDDIVGYHYKKLITNKEKNFAIKKLKQNLENGMSLSEASSKIKEQLGISVSAGKWQIAEDTRNRINAEYDAKLKDLEESNDVAESEVTTEEVTSQELETDQETIAQKIVDSENKDTEKTKFTAKELKIYNENKDTINSRVEALKQESVKPKSDGEILENNTEQVESLPIEGKNQETSEQAQPTETDKTLKDLKKKTETGKEKPAQYAQRIMADPNTTSWMKEEADKNGNYKEASQGKANNEADKLISSFKKKYGVKDGLRAAKDLLINNTSQIPPIMRGTLGAKISMDMQLQDMRSEGVELANFQTERGTDIGQEMAGRKANASPEQVVSLALTKLDQKNQEKLEAAKTKNGVPYIQAIEALQNDLRSVKEDFEAFKKSQPKTTTKAKPVTGQALIKKAKEKRKAGLDLINKSLKGNRGQLNSGIPLDSDLFKGLQQVFQSYLLETRGNFQLAFDKLKKDVKGKLPKDVTLEDYQKALSENNQEILDEITRDEQVQLIKQFIKSTRKSKGEINDAKIKDIEALVDEFNETGEISSDTVYEFAPEVAGIETIDSKTRKEILTETREISELTAEGRDIEASKKWEKLQNKLIDLKIRKYDIGDLLYDLWYTNTLSGITTVRRSTFGSTMTTLLFNTTRLMANPHIAKHLFSIFGKKSNWKDARVLFGNTIRTGDTDIQFRDYKADSPSYFKRLVNTDYKDLDLRDGAVKTSMTAIVYSYRTIIAQDAALSIFSEDFNYSVIKYNEIVKDFKDSNDGKITKEQRTKAFQEMLKSRHDEYVAEAKDLANKEYESIKKSNPKYAKELGEAFKTKRYREILRSKRDRETTKLAMQDAKKAAMVNDPEGWLGAAYSAFSSFLSPKKNPETTTAKVGNVVKQTTRISFFSFIRVWTNYINMSLEYTPLGIAKSLNIEANKSVWTKDGNREVKDYERREKAVRGVLGTGLATIVALFIFDFDDDEGFVLKKDAPFMITGNLNGQWWNIDKTKSDAKPWSISFLQDDGTYGYSYSFLDNPMAFLLAPIGIMSDQMRYKKFKTKVKGVTDDSENVFYSKGLQAMLWGGVNYAMDQSFMQNLDDLGSIISPDPSNPQNTSEKAANIFLRPASNFVNPALYRQTVDYIKAYMDEPLKDKEGFSDVVMKNLPIARHFLDNDKYDLFGYPMIKKFDVPMVPDWFLEQIKENIDYRQGIPEWKLLLKYPEVIVSGFKLPRQINNNRNIDESVNNEFQRRCGEAFREYVSYNYKSLDELGPMELQVELNKYRLYAKNDVVNYMQGKDMLIKKKKK